MTSSSPDSTILSETAIKQHVSQELAGTDIVFSMDITGLSNSEIATILDTLAPASAFPNGKLARVSGLTLTATSVTSFSQGSIGNPNIVTGVSTSTILNRTRNNDLIFTLTNGNWAYTSG